MVSRGKCSRISTRFSMITSAMPPPAGRTTASLVCPGQAPRRDGLPAVEARLAFVDEGLSGFAVVLGEPGVRMVGHFQVHAFTQLAGYGAVQVLLHVAVSDRRPLRQPAGALHDLPFEVDGREDGVDDPEPLGFLGTQ